MGSTPTFNRRHRDAEDREQMVRSLALSVEARDQHTGGHCRRLGKLAISLAGWLDLPEANGLICERSGYLHDIGKIGIPDSILLKPSSLTRSEWRTMRDHPSISEQILRPLDFLEPVLPVVRHHHERWDGQGYPDSLAGRRMSLIARVIQVIDAYDALTSQRPYCQMLSPATALDLIQTEAADGRFDLDVVKIFVNRMAVSLSR
jgi:putative two-component system response regulator